MFQDLTVQELRAKRDSGELVIIDVRSPSEYEESTIPGSINIPFFDDRERAEIGTLYKQVSVQDAKKRGLEIISAKLPAFIAQFAAIPQKKALFCWRGGMRSRTTATLLSLMDIHAYRLSGGFREYRRWVVETLAEFSFDQRAYVIHGNTGTGKTAILSELERRGYPVLDLEGMAGHRGSIFGQIGMRAHNQKTFESLLLERLIALRHSPYVLMEAESRRIGKCVLPEFLMEAKEAGIPIRVELPIGERIRHILEDYRPEEHKQQCMAAFRVIKPRIHTPVAAEIEQSILNDDFGRAAELLLTAYYDPRYEHGSDRYDSEKELFVQADSAVAALEPIIAALPSSGVPV
ncbi:MULTISPECIES: tRNA 2-selenouridine(34) synthase MnmH [unclassified Paenibacillus]|uniref:tRNA 2-selenouridine(34) synthase MnmH n=1 Tax=unclassified Paenibacillus TaxID=185978 RepID=UPI0009561ED2|nr:MULTISPECIES: tRNA 2-selenouridine(34) synthase MnmH [unclassified Paenibacillus]ASS65540.1 tRNA 2-selenouridine(34) synthase MnmH [Paenibacillus sp. RUD330]SIQ32681.1 tRNA 2-selenouridine synthase [Paenibacillus sp. RU4X]SIQ54277.1 tRNA 2-selenouridine synthase [Paenibacillus sp. RU4T]